jgi:hypothetical protein
VRDIIEAINSRVVIFDGGMGATLIRRLRVHTRLGRVASRERRPE